ncbi:ScbR family autoregulator-binding transcription factor [Leifsonia bigeumensis]|uniref:ScbR family autoregulator-binding transcription factor n=1 Tax=Leifsonella bigeumensis TaxID=433643 RepID=A0ABP7F5I5_9MICO
MLKQERARITRGNIVSSASRSFHDHGFARASLSDIIEEAGVTKGALYFHFESKEDVAAAVLDAQLEHVTAVFTELENSGRPPLELLVDLCSLPARPREDEQELPVDFRLATELASLQPALAFSFYERWLQMITALTRRAEAAGALKSGIDPDVLSRFLLDTITGTELLFAVFSAGEEREDHGRGLWRLLLPQIAAEEYAQGIDRILDRVFSPV